MSKIFILTAIIVATASINSFGQKNSDNRIIVTLPDDTDIYSKVRMTFIDNDFIVKDNGNKDTLSTYPIDMNFVGGVVKLWAVISGNKVTFFGIFSLKKINYFGMNYNTDESSRIIYYSGSQSWKTMKGVAEKLGGQITYLKQ